MRKHMATEALTQIRKACLDMSADWTGDQREFVKVALRATVPDPTAITDMSDSELCVIRNLIHRTFGAPGDWGYGTPLGAALKQLYQA
jgi:hypothetical protein